MYSIRFHPISDLMFKALSVYDLELVMIVSL